MSAAMSNMVLAEERVVFNTIACSNTHLNGSEVLVMGSCTSTAGEWDISSTAMLQQQARRRMKEYLVSTDRGKIRDNKHHCAQTV